MAQQGFVQPGAGLASPLLGPDIAQKQYEMAQRQAYAQALMQQGMEPLQGQNVNGHYVAPSWTQGLAKALSGYMGMKAMADMPKQQQELQDMQMQRQAQLFGLGQPQGGNAAAQAYPVGASGQQPMQQSMPSGQPQVPLLPGRSAQESFTIAQGMGLPAYLKLAAEQGNTTTDFQKNLIAQGIRPGSPQWNAALGANLEKQNYIAPPSAAPGATMLNPRTMQPVFSAPQNGMQLAYGPNGVAQAIPVAGYSDITAQQEGAKARATAQGNAAFDLVERPNPNGQGTSYYTREQLAQEAQAGNPAAAKPDARANKANDIINLANEAGSILKDASSGLIGGLITTGSEALGRSTDSSKADARLKVISGQLVMNMPRMEGPQSDADRLLYQQMAGDIANPKIPRETRAAALQTIIGLQQKYAPSAPAAAPATPTPAGGMAMPKSAQDYAALPSGTLFRDPTGLIRRKP